MRTRARDWLIMVTDQNEALRPMGCPACFSLRVRLRLFLLAGGAAWRRSTCRRSILIGLYGDWLTRAGERMNRNTRAVALVNEPVAMARGILRHRTAFDAPRDEAAPGV